MKKYNLPIKTAGYFLLLITMVSFTDSCEDSTGSAYPGSGKWINGNMVNGEWVVNKSTDEGLDLSLITYARNNTGKLQWLSSELLKEDKYHDLKLLKNPAFKIQMVTSVFIKQDEFTGFEPGKEHDFKVRREAGTIAFNGKVTDTRGSGEFEFTPDQTFLDYLQQLGYSRIPPEKEIYLFTANINKIYFDDIRALKYNHLPMDRIIKFAVHGVSVPFIKDIHDLGYKDMSPDKLVKFRIHGVSPEFIQEIYDAGFKDISPDTLVKFRIHGVTSEFIREIHEAGFKDMSPDKLVKFRVHGVSPEFIQEIHEAGLKDISSDKLVEFRIHGVTPQFIREIKQAGHKEITPDKLVVFRIHGVNGQNVEQKGNESTMSEKGMNVINMGSLAVTDGRLQLSNSGREISMSLIGCYLMTSQIIHTDDIIQLYFQSTNSNAKTSFVVEPHIGTLPDSRDKTWDTLKQMYKNHKIRPESWVRGEIDGLPSTTYIADYDKEGKKMIEYCTYIINKQHLGLLELHVEKKDFDKIKTDFERMIQTFKWKEN